MWCTEEGTALPMKSANQNPSGTARVFLLSPDGTISVFPAEPDARAALACGDSLFEHLADLKRLTAEWPITRLVSLWNGIPGVAPIRKFRDRTTAWKRIWDAIQALEPVRPQPEDPSPPTPDSTGKARSGTKKAALLTLLARDNGATVREIMAALGWQSHSVRGCLSSLSRKGPRIHSFRRPDGERAYSSRTSVESDKEAAQ